MAARISSVTPSEGKMITEATKRIATEATNVMALIVANLLYSFLRLKEWSERETKMRITSLHS
jgi:hypothetical protein